MNMLINQIVKNEIIFKFFLHTETYNHENITDIIILKVKIFSNIIEYYIVLNFYTAISYKSTIIIIESGLIFCKENSKKNFK